jgi:hypothetical protein
MTAASKLAHELQQATLGSSCEEICTAVCVYVPNTGSDIRVKAGVKFKIKKTKYFWNVSLPFIVLNINK